MYFSLMPSLKTAGYMLLASAKASKWDIHLGSSQSEMSENNPELKTSGAIRSDCSKIPFTGQYKTNLAMLILHP